MAQRLAIFCDGTWNSPDQAHNGTACPTNVAKLAAAVLPKADGTVQRIYYHRGVGTGPWYDRFFGGAFGVGLSDNIRHAYRFLVETFAPGDEIFLFGFSRGAYTARSLVGLIRNSGLLRREHADRIDDAYRLYRSRRPDTHPRQKEAVLFRRTFSHEPPIRFLGVWDTVGSLGVPIQITGIINRGLRFHDTELSKSIEGAYHALAIDERRRFFLPTVWSRKDAAAAGQALEQVWFIGAHSNVGGGYPDQGLSDIALHWMAKKAFASGLGVDFQELKLDLDPLRVPIDSRKRLYKLLPSVSRDIGAAQHGMESVHESVLQRYSEDPRYRPRNLTKYLADHPEVLERWRERVNEQEAQERAA
ncbi:MAG TPA: DUF2235 domain-containing protein [Thermoanaerobaculia bacterium]|nr:DUF2235 domain-containing protein [Thermoanaerobaculia bacterium]